KAKKAKKPGAGDFAANLELTDASQKLTLGKASIAGNLTSGLWDVNGNIGSITVKGAAEGAAGLPGTVRADGNIKRITLGACRHFDFFAGGFNPGVNRRADGAGDFNVAAAATIKSVKIKGWKLPRAAGIPRFFQDSNFSAATIKKASVLNIEMGDGGGLYALKDLPGRRGLGITSVTYKDTDSGTKWRYPSKSFSAVPDFNIFEL
ncbi:MAG: hypothetical protein HQ546_11685, partial [Planctomycetes bacterium]|nr:hypothetical protein [Planctomycetota bacterium]